MVDGEVYPPTIKDAPIRMNYPSWIPPEKTFAIGQEMFGIIPGLTLYATLWLREHNRVCDILKAEHPTWDDEQLFQTSRLIIIGEKSLTITVFLTNYTFTACSCGLWRHVSTVCYYCWVTSPFTEGKYTKIHRWSNMQHISTLSDFFQERQ